MVSLSVEDWNPLVSYKEGGGRESIDLTLAIYCVSPSTSYCHILILSSSMFYYSTFYTHTPHRINDKVSPPLSTVM